MTDICPVCGRGTVELFEAGDGEWGSRTVDHIQCVLQMQTNAQIAAKDAEYWSIEWAKAHVLCDRYRDLFLKANQEKRDWRDVAMEYLRLFDAEHDVCEGEMGDSLYFQELASRYERLFKRANAEKRRIKRTRNALLDVAEALLTGDDYEVEPEYKVTVSTPPKPTEPPNVTYRPWQEPKVSK